MKVDPYPRFPTDQAQSVRKLTDLHRELALQLNLLSEGTQGASHAARSSVPTTGTYATGDFVLNSAPASLGGAGSVYIIHGWRCTAGGTPGTFVQCRFLTGA